MQTDASSGGERWPCDKHASRPTNTHPRASEQSSTGIRYQKVDIRFECPSVENVSYIRRIAAFLLLAIWLTAMQHCTLEAADLWDSHDDSAIPVCCSSSGTCTHDGCNIVERGPVTASSMPVKAPVPTLNECLCMLCVQHILPDTEVECSAEFAQQAIFSAGWVPVWHFERRTAHSPRAPSLIQA